MLFNFELFTAFAIKAYSNVGESDYSLEDVLSVFEYYFLHYEESRQVPHPKICIEQIEWIISTMPNTNDSIDLNAEIDPDSYRALIDKHFETDYMVGKGGCDYNINHFFSGNIRASRYYEALYRKQMKGSMVEL